MTRIYPLIALATMTSTLAPAGAQTQDHAPSQIRSAPQLRHDKGEAWNYVKPGLNLSRYTAILVDPATVYTGPDAQFANVPVADRKKFADIITAALRSELSTVGLASRPGPHVLRLRVTLLGADKTTGGVSTVSHVLPLGLVTNAVKSVAGKKGSFTGSVLIAIELVDSTTGELQAAAVRRKSPDALDIPATVSTSDTVKAVARDIAKHVGERLRGAMRRG